MNLNITNLLLHQVPLEAAASSVLSGEALEEKEAEFSDEELERSASTENWSRQKKSRLIKLKNLLKELPEAQKKKFDPIIAFPGLESWLEFLSERV